MERIHVEIVNKKITPIFCKLEQKHAAPSPDPYTFELNKQPKTITVPHIGTFNFEMDDTIAYVTISSPYEIHASIGLGEHPVPFDDITRRGSREQTILMSEWATFTNRRVRTSVTFKFDNEPPEQVAVAVTNQPNPPALTAVAEAIPDRES